MKSAILLTLAASASAFAPTSTNSRATVAVQETRADLEILAKELNPTVGFYDPLNLADAEFWGATNEQTIGFLRHAEIKHGRVAMFAFVGYIVHANGIKFPWAMQMDGASFPTGTNPPELWDQVGDAAKWQIFGLIFFLEAWSEIGTADHPHYMRGGKPGDMPDFDGVDEMKLPHPVPFNYFDPFGISKKRSPEAKAKGLRAEINNGRLAQLGIFGFLCEQTIPGSVPLLSKIVEPYSGEVMAPFSENVLGMPFGM